MNVLSLKDLEDRGFVRISDVLPDLCDYYYINEYGDIYSTKTNTMLNKYCDKDGYYRQTLSLKNKPVTGSKYKLIGVHKLVNFVFNGAPPKDMYQPVTDHIDGNVKNNYCGNLRWISMRDNSSYAYKHTQQLSSIKDEDVPIIFNMYCNEHKSTKEIADIYNTVPNYICGILTGVKRAPAIEKYNLTPIEDLRYNRDETIFPDSDICKIFRMYNEEHKTINEIAAMYNTDNKYIHAVLTGKKRRVALERYGLTPIKPKSFMTPEEVDKIIYDYLTHPGIPKTEIARRNNTTEKRVKHLVYKDSFKERSEYIDFDNRNIEYDPNKQIKCEEDFHLMNDFYTQFEYNPNKENCLNICDIESGNVKGVTIGETEYYTNWQ